MSDVLLAAMERLHDAVANRRGPDVIGPLLDDVARLSAEHFATEERVLRRYGYRQAGKRSAQHARLLRKVPNLQQDLLEGKRKGPGVTRFLYSLSQQAGYRQNWVA